MDDGVPDGIPLLLGFPGDQIPKFYPTCLPARQLSLEIPFGNLVAP
jgi:hypothetical protein